MLEKIHKITKEQAQKLIFLGVTVLIFVLPLPQLVWPENRRTIALQATILMFALFYFGFILVVEGLNKRLNIMKSGVAVKCVIGLILIGVCSVIISDSKTIALYGSWIRYEGFFSLMSYYIIFLVIALLENKRYRQMLVYCFLGLGSAVSVLGILQFMGIYVFGNRFPGMAYVPMRNPNFFAAFAVMFVGVAIGGFFLYDKNSKITHPFSWWNRGVWYIFVLLGYTACICTASSIIYVGIIMIFLLYLFLEIATKRRRFLSFFSLLLGFVALVLLFDLFQNGNVVRELVSVGEQIQAEGSLFGDSVGTDRMLLWKQTISLLPKYGLFGCGIDQLENVCFEAKVGEKFIYFDKAHNEYLNLWVTEGFFALIIYLAFLFALFFPGVKQFLKKKKDASVVQRAGENEIAQIVLFAFFGYITQAFFNISVVQVAPYFWMICGLLYSGKRRINEETKDS